MKKLNIASLREKKMKAHKRAKRCRVPVCVFVALVALNTRSGVLYSKNAITNGVVLSPSGKYRIIKKNSSLCPTIVLPSTTVAHLAKRKEQFTILAVKEKRALAIVIMLFSN